MYREDMTRYDKKPADMNEDLRHHGPHFSKELAAFAASKMYKLNDKGDKEYIKPYTKQEVDDILRNNKVVLKNKDTLYDYVYVANMCKADLLGDSVPNERYLALYVKNVIDDPDGYDGITFTRWYGDMCKKGIPIDWYSMI